MSEQQLETRYYVLERLVKWDKITTVNEMLVRGDSPRVVSTWCKENGFSISHPKLYEYKDLLTEAIAKKISVEKMLGIGKPSRTPILLQSLGISPQVDLVTSELEVLDGIIQLGFNTIKDVPAVRMSDVMKAIELKDKLTGGTHGNLTTYGLEQLRALEEAKFGAVLGIVLQYLPEDKHEEVYDAMQHAEHKFYREQAPELLDDYEAAIKAEMGNIEATGQHTPVNPPVSGEDF